MTLFPFILLGAVFVWLYFRLRATYTIPPRWRIDGPACGNCAYSYTGQPVCPECGHAIKHVGIVTPRLLIMFGPGMQVALSSLLIMGMICGGGMFAIGYALEEAFLPPGGRSGAGSNLSQEAMLHEVTFTDFNNNSRPGEDTGGWINGNAPFGLTVVSQAVRDNRGMPPFTTLAGEIVMVVRPLKQRPYTPSPTQSVFAFVPPLPHLRIDIVKKSVRVFDANATLIAEYPTIDVRAFDDLFKAAAINGKDKMTQMASEAAEKVYTTIAAAPDNGGWGPGWSFGISMLSTNGVSIMSNGGNMTSVAPIPSSMVPKAHVLTSVWPTLVVALNIAAIVVAYRWILRRRRAIMEAGAVYAAAPAAS